MKKKQINASAVFFFVFFSPIAIFQPILVIERTDFLSDIFVYIFLAKSVQGTTAQSVTSSHFLPYCIRLNGNNLPLLSLSSYELMLQCWNKEPSKRPKFNNIVDWMETSYTRSQKSFELKMTRDIFFTGYYSTDRSILSTCSEENDGILIVQFYILNTYCH